MCARADARIGRVARAFGLGVLVLLAAPHLGFPQQGDLETAARLDLQVGTLYREGRYKEALPIAERSLAIREKALGPEHPYVATSLYNLAVPYRDLGDYPKNTGRCILCILALLVGK